jgi:uncharacterized membrane protein (UPF0136 family)
MGAVLEVWAMLDVGKISLLVLAVLVCAGGAMGFLKARSKMSLIAGMISAALLATCYSIACRNPDTGFLLGQIVCGLLIAIFGFRLYKTKKFMPSGLMLALSAVELVLLFFA